MGTLLVAALLVQGCGTSDCDKPGAGNWRIKMPLLVAPQADSIRLGDTLSVTVRIPYNNTSIRDGRPYNVATATPGSFGLELSLYNRLANGQPFIEGVNNFDIIAITGEMRDFNDVTKTCFLAPTADAFVFRAKLVAQKKGLVGVAISGASGNPGVKCATVSYVPDCINVNRNHLLYQQFHQIFTDILPEGKYFIWVR